MIEFNAGVCRNLQDANEREWLETNGLGGYASSTITGLNTRRYHALLMAAVRPPAERMALLSKLEATLIVNGQPFDLSVNQYSGDGESVIHPQGHLLLTGFRLDPWPVFTYLVAGVEIEKSICMIHGENTVVVQFKMLGRDRDVESCHLELRPLVAFRDYHSTAHENDSIDRSISESEELISIRPWPGLPELHFAHNADSVRESGHWYRNFEYSIERNRGLDFKEDLFNHFVLGIDLGRLKRSTLIVSTNRHEINDAAGMIRHERERRGRIEGLSSGHNLSRALTLAADQFIVDRGAQKSVIAGYHWFADWGRDTMIALPGLSLSTGRIEIAKSILLEFSYHVSQGMLPNRFTDDGETPEYNTVDATLWYFEAIRRLIDLTGDYDFVRENLYSTLVEIIERHVDGTRYGIHRDEDGLLYAGVPGVQLTWMDAKVGDWVITPRIGKPVEIQALWYNALRVIENLSETFGDQAAADRYGKFAEMAYASFNRIFWNSETGCLYDVVNGEDRDGSIRPNQIFSISLGYPILEVERSLSVIETMREQLLTPFGLRTLSPHDPAYRGAYQGGVVSRDSAYHQGTVWPWLLGPFIEAYLKVNGKNQHTRMQAGLWLVEIEKHLSHAGLGNISEVFDGDAPHRPGGCIAQAWSVAEILRVINEYEL